MSVIAISVLMDSDAATGEQLRRAPLRRGLPPPSQQELLRHLRANGFKNFIVSGGGADFMRVWVERVANPRPSLGLIVHHTDGDREYAYDAETKSTGKLVEALEEAPGRGWLVADMKQDWNAVFAPA